MKGDRLKSLLSMGPKEATHTLTGVAKISSAPIRDIPRKDTAHPPQETKGLENPRNSSPEAKDILNTMLIAILILRAEVPKSRLPHHTGGILLQGTGRKATIHETLVITLNCTMIFEGLPRMLDQRLGDRMEIMAMREGCTLRNQTEGE